MVINRTLNELGGVDEPVRLSCSMRGRPAPHIFWLKDGHPISGTVHGLYDVIIEKRAIDDMSWNSTSTLVFRGQCI